MKGKIRWGIIGPGKIARKFAEDLKRIKEAEVSAVASRNRERAVIFAEEFDVPHVFESYEALFTSNIVDIEIRDNGTGIDSQHLDKVFDMFFRAAESKNQGSGLGLYIVKDTVHKIGGEITLNSKVGQGSTFKITLKNAVVDEKGVERAVNTTT